MKGVGAESLAGSQQRCKQQCSGGANNRATLGCPHLCPALSTRLMLSFSRCIRYIRSVELLTCRCDRCWSLCHPTSPTHYFLHYFPSYLPWRVTPGKRLPPVLPEAGLYGGCMPAPSLAVPSIKQRRHANVESVHGCYRLGAVLTQARAGAMQSLLMHQ